MSRFFAGSDTESESSSSEEELMPQRSAPAARYVYSNTPRSTFVSIWVYIEQVQRAPPSPTLDGLGLIIL